MSFKVIPQATGHLGINQLKSPLGEFEKRKKINMNASKTCFNEEHSSSVREQFSPQTSNFL
jgi:hypothetical protein